MKENNQEKIRHLQLLSGWDKDKCEMFINMVYEYLDACGYFMGDFNIHGLDLPKDYVKYRDRDFGKWLLDMALQYNMEQGKEYQVKLVNSHGNH